MTRILQFSLFAILLISATCKQENRSDLEHKHTNALAEETSPYLLQHAHNPVNWLAWNDETLALAKKENKPLLISIGYSACHWCHVMEHESFEDTNVAQLMNKYFICVKVDREERPDVDQVYMDAVQLMTGGGGWPLNCFALPDGRPFFGGTYFKKAQWMQILEKLGTLYLEEPEKVEEYAKKLTDGLVQMDDMPLVDIPEEFNSEVVETAVARWKKSFDLEEGGPNRSPKFPMPNNYQFLLAHAKQTEDNELMNYVHLTLRKIAFGGIYDQVGGGFARYSTDEQWKVPHFEKMLYDNAQLLGLYSQAYSQNKDSLYYDIIQETATWIEREMTSNEGAFYSALDADSEGVEGKFYVWKKEEIKSIAGDDFDIIADYFNINPRGLWEHGNYILLRHDSDEKVAKKHKITDVELRRKISMFKHMAYSTRDQRVHPGLDDKSLTSWNALTCKGLTEAYIATQNERWLSLAKRNYEFLIKTQMQEDGRLWHSFKAGRSTINGYLEDYAHLIDASLKLYEATFDETYIRNASKLIEYVFVHFEQNPNGLFYFKSKDDAELVAKRTEATDNIIPASNSVLATCFYKIALLLADEQLLELSSRMLAQVESKFSAYPPGNSQWMLLHQFRSSSFHEVAVVGEDCLQFLQEMNEKYLPNVVFCGGEKNSALPILDGKFVDGKTLVYVCKHGACKLPSETTKSALAKLR